MNNVVRIIVCALRDQVRNCLKYGLRCLDPPVLTSGMLRRYGIKSDHTIVNFWHRVQTIVSRFEHLEIYRSRHMVFALYMQHSLEDAYKLVDLDIYVDPIDCEHRQCLVAPHSHVLRIYFVGNYSNLNLKINVISLLKLVSVKEPRFLTCLDRLAQDPLSEDNIIRVSLCVLSILNKYRTFLARFIEKVPNTLTNLINLSPLLRSSIRRSIHR